MSLSLNDVEYCASDTGGSKIYELFFYKVFKHSCIVHFIPKCCFLSHLQVSEVREMFIKNYLSLLLTTAKGIE